MAYNNYLSLLGTLGQAQGMGPDEGLANWSLPQGGPPADLAGFDMISQGFREQETAQPGIIGVKAKDGKVQIEATSQFLQEVMASLERGKQMEQAALLQLERKQEVQRKTRIADVLQGIAGALAQDPNMPGWIRGLGAYNLREVERRRGELKEAENDYEKMQAYRNELAFKASEAEARVEGIKTNRAYREEMAETRRLQAATTMVQRGIDDPSLYEAAGFDRKRAEAYAQEGKEIDAFKQERIAQKDRNSQLINDTRMKITLIQDETIRRGQTLRAASAAARSEGRATDPVRAYKELMDTMADEEKAKASLRTELMNVRAAIASTAAGMGMVGSKPEVEAALAKQLSELTSFAEELQRTMAEKERLIAEQYGPTRDALAALVAKRQGKETGKDGKPLLQTSPGRAKGNKGNLRPGTEDDLREPPPPPPLGRNPKVTVTPDAEAALNFLGQTLKKK